MKKNKRDKMTKIMVYFILIIFLASLLPVIFTR